MPFIWDLWTTLSKATDPIHLSARKAETFGTWIVDAMKTLPPAFSGPIRDPHLKRQSQYKVYEWMALLHWYILPMGLELGFPPSALKNFAKLVKIIEFAMTPIPRTEDDLADLLELISEFLEEYERIYVQGKPENISRMRLCVFQLIHIPLHIKWNGSIRAGSQSTVERGIGEMARKIHSKKAPFANLAMEIFERELLILLALTYPNISAGISPPLSGSKAVLRVAQAHPLSKRSWQDAPHNAAFNALSERCRRDGIDLSKEEYEVKRWGKLHLPNGHALRSVISEQKAMTRNRQYRWFEVRALALHCQWRLLSTH